MNISQLIIHVFLAIVTATIVATVFMMSGESPSISTGETVDTAYQQVTLHSEFVEHSRLADSLLSIHGKLLAQDTRLRIYHFKQHDPVADQVVEAEREYYQELNRGYLKMAVPFVVFLLLLLFVRRFLVHGGFYSL